MPVLKFKVFWSEDSDVFRTIEVLSQQTFNDFHQCIKQSFTYPDNTEASFFMSNEHWTKGKEISSTVLKNIRDAVALSMIKTPLGALINDPFQKLIYECQSKKSYEFHIQLIEMKLEESTSINYPFCIKSEGTSPNALDSKMKEKDVVLEIEEKFDLNNVEDGFGDEGEDENLNDGAEENEEEGAEESFENWEDD